MRENASKRKGRKAAGRIRNIFIKAILTLGLMAAVFCLTGTVKAVAGEVNERQREAYYEELEENYVKEIRRLCKENGLYNAGIMLERVREADGSRVYTLYINHSHVKYMEAKKLEKMQKAARELEFSEEGCTFIQQFSGFES